MSHPEDFGSAADSVPERTDPQAASDSGATSRSPQESEWDSWVDGDLGVPPDAEPGASAPQLGLQASPQSSSPPDSTAAPRPPQGKTHPTPPDRPLTEPPPQAPTASNLAPGSSAPGSSVPGSSASPPLASPPLAMVETAFLASTASLLWLINFYFPFGPLLRLCFPIPIALVYLRWNLRSAWMAAIVSSLLLSVLMGPVRSLFFLMPSGLLGVLLGACWRQQRPWWVSISLGSVVNTLGFFFRVALTSVLLGEDLWIYVTTQVTRLLDWIALRFNLLVQPDLTLVQLLAIVLVMINSLVYLFTVHLVAWYILERLGARMPAPPRWVQVILEMEPT